MSEQHPGNRPGHLDIDAVSAFVDRDLVADDLAIIEIHLHDCPACHREVLEIRTTVTLLAALPQYTPRRSFCLGHEHARAARRRDRISERYRVPESHDWSSSLPAAYPVAAERGSGAGWVPGLQAAAMVIGAMLLLVTSSDLVGMPPQPAAWLAEPAVVRLEYLAPTVPAAEAPPPQAFAPAADGDVAPAPGDSAPEAAIRVASDQAQGTAGGDSASQEVLVAEDEAQTAPSIATSAAMAAVTQAVPTPGVVARAARGPETASGGDEPGPAEVEVVDQPSKLRLVQIALALALAWLVVSIVGLRWVRGLR